MTDIRGMSRDHFAEWAEALGVSTMCIIGVQQTKGQGYDIVLWTATPDPAEKILVSRAARRDDGRMFEMRPRLQMNVDFDEYVERIEELVEQQPDPTSVDWQEYFHVERAETQPD